MLKLVFMGTPTFAIPSVVALEKAGYILTGVVTQPNRRKGRGKKLMPPPVKKAAERLGIPVYQPSDPNASDFIKILLNLTPDVIVTAAFGHLLKEEILTLPSMGCINLHASLLPKYRGAAPIARAILNGETFTGVSTMLMDEGMDTGPILQTASVTIRLDDTTESLTGRLAEVGAALLVETLAKWTEGAIKPAVQDESRATIAPPLTKEDGKINWQRPAEEIERQIRAMIPWPGAFSKVSGKGLKVFRAEVVHTRISGVPGSSIVTDESWIVATGEGSLSLHEVQMEGKKRQTIRSFLKGFKQRGEVDLAFP